MTDNIDKNLQSGESTFYLATVSQVTNSGIKIQLDRETEPMEKPYKRIYTVRAGNRVLVLKMNGTFIVLGPLSPQ